MCLFLVVLGLCCCVGFFPPSCREWRLLSSCRVQAPHCSGFSCCSDSRALGLRCLWHVGSAVLASGPQWLLWYTGLVAPQHVGSPGSGTEALSPALAAGFCTAEPTGKPSDKSILRIVKGTDGEMLFLMDIKLSSLLHWLPAIPAAKRCPRKRGKFSFFPGACFPPCQTPVLTNFSMSEMTGYLRAILDPT